MAAHTFFGKSAKEQKLLYDLKERVKEQTALLAVTEHLLSADDVPTIIAKCMEPIRSGWQFPAYTEVAINTISWGDYSTGGFPDLRWKQTAEITGAGKTHGILSVGYAQLPPESTAGVFLPEEERLITGLAKLLGIFLDQCVAVQQLKESREQIIRITSHTPANTFLFEMFDNQPLKIHFAMKGFTKHFNTADMDDLVADSGKINDVIHVEDQPRFYASLKQAHTDGSNISVQYRIVAAGTIAWRWFRASPEKQKDGRTLWYGSAQDITPIVEYTKVLEQIIFDISHVIRRPVSTMLGITDLLREDSVPDEKTTREIAKHLKTIAAEMDNYLTKLNAAYLERKVNAEPLVVNEGKN